LWFKSQLLEYFVRSDGVRTKLIKAVPRRSSINYIFGHMHPNTLVISVMQFGLARSPACRPAM